ncbi:PAAR domain-containing protein [Pseudovibrio japonicus]|nr:PAAR domain-containing protein [Pseudovibrio japonicus]
MPGLPASRVTDMHVCPMVTGIIPHVGGPIMPPGQPLCLIAKLPAATATGMATCVGPPDIIAKGSTTCLISKLPAVRVGDTCAHGGTVILGSPLCLVGG